MKNFTTLLFSLFMVFGFLGNVTGQVRINEIRSDDASSDDIEFIELIGVAGTDLTDYQIVHRNGAGDSDIFTYTITSFTIPDDGITDDQSNSLGFFVLGVDSSLINPDQVIPESLQNGPDGIILYDDSGDIVDAVAWQGAGDISSGITTSGSPSADNYLHVTSDDDTGDNSLQAPNDVVGDNGSGWTLAAATIGAINDGQTSGSIIITSSIKAEPANHVSSFSVTGVINSVNISWTDATGSPLPDAYLIKISNVGFGSISTPVDGTSETNDSDLSDGSGVLNINFGEESASFSGLDETTTYYFKIYPYTNTGSDIDYKTDGTIPQDDATTLETPDIVFNEILADPDGTTGDSNGDGIVDTDDDEFIELVNTGTVDIDVSGWVFADNSTDRYTFPASTTLKPSQAAVIFGGGTPTGDFGGSFVDSTSSLGLNNGGETITLENDSGVQIISLTYSGATNQSETRSPDLTGDFADHETADTDDASSFSPGTRIDGSTFQPSVEITGSEGWRILSTPTSSSTYNDLLGDLWTQGIATGADVTNGTSNVQTFDGSSFSGISDMGATMTVGSGFITYVYSDDDYDGSAEGFPKTLEVFAVPNSGTVSPTLTSGANAWTLVGNPYASTIDWDDLGKTDLTGTVYVYDHSYGSPSGADVEASGSAGSYRVWNGTSGSLTDGLITPFQGFWVQNSASATSEALSIEEADKTTGGTFYKSSNNLATTIKFQARTDAAFSESYLSFTETGELAKDNNDGLKLTPLDFRDYLSVSTVTENIKLDINNLPAEFDNEIDILLSVENFMADADQGSWVAKAGEVTLSWPVMENLPEDWSVTLTDFETGTTVDMKTADEYVFTLEGDTQQKKSAPSTTILMPQPPQPERLAKSAEGPRFSIIITSRKATSNEPMESPEAFTLEQNYPNPFNPTTSIEYSVAQAGPVSITIYNVMGQQVATLVSEAKAEGTYRVNWNAANMASGIYHYRLQSAGQVITKQMTLIK